MVKQIYLYSILSFALISCNSKNYDKLDSQNNNPLIVKLNAKIDFYHILPKHIPQAVIFSLKNADNLLNSITSLSDSMRSFENTLLKLDDLYNIIFKVWDPLETFQGPGKKCTHQ